MNISKGKTERDSQIPRYLKGYSYVPWISLSESAPGGVLALADPYVRAVCES